MNIVGYIISLFLLLIGILAIVSSYLHIKTFKSLTGSSPTGPTGNPGPTGPRGPTGDPGVQGANGPPSNIISTNLYPSFTANGDCMTLDGAKFIGLSMLNFDATKCRLSATEQGICPGLDSTRPPPLNYLNTYCIDPDWTGGINQSMQSLITGTQPGYIWLRYGNMKNDQDWTDFKKSND